MISFDQLRELMESNRSYRRFDNKRAISEETIISLIELTRYCASGRNLQPLRYRIVTSKEECNVLFPCLKWAGYYSDWDGPSESERPVAYIVQCIDTDLTNNLLCDDGLQLAAITLGGSSLGIHGVIIKAFNVAEASRLLNIPERYKPLYVVALGYPAEKIKIIDTDGTTGADIRYFHDDSGVHTVPKRPLKELIIK